RNWQYAKGTLMINALLRAGLLMRYMPLLFLLLLSITMSPAAGITAPLPLELPLPLSELPLQQHQQLHQQHHTSGNYYEPAVSEALAGLAGYAQQQHYYGANGAAGVGGATQARHTLQHVADDDVDGDVGNIGDLAAPPYANYEPRAEAITAAGFVPTTALHGYNNNNNYDSYSNYNNYNSYNNYNGYNGYNNGLHSDAYDGKIDFVINTANYGLDGSGEQQLRGEAPPSPPPSPPGIYYPPPPLPLTLPQAGAPLLDYPIEQFSNYRHTSAGSGVEQQQLQQLEKVAPQPRQLNDVSARAYAGSQQQQQHLQQQQQLQQLQQQRQQRQQSETRFPAQDQQLAARHLVDLPSGGSHNSVAASSNSLPPITTTVHHTPSSSKAIAGLPLAKHIEVTKHVPVTHYQKQHVPFKQPVPLRVSRPVITTIPKPIPIRVPVPKTVAVPQLQEVKIPVEKVRPVAVERPIPFVVERRVPYRVEKPIATPMYYPYPVKVPIIRTVVHKQRPSHKPNHRWAPLNHLLG
ncbi:hypothetical protein KR093_002964, partial [Drosophila rubida]